MEKERQGLVFQNQKIATNCSTYVQLKAISPIQESPTNMNTSKEYLNCDALKILKTSRPVDKTTKTNKKLIIKALASKFDLRSFRSSLHQRTNQNSYTLKSLFPNDKLISKNSIHLKTKDWSYKIELIASVLINNNKKPDWVLWLYDEALQGNYRGYQTLVLIDPDSNKMIKASNYSRPIAKNINNKNTINTSQNKLNNQMLQYLQMQQKMMGIDMLNDASDQATDAVLGR